MKLPEDCSWMSHVSEDSSHVSFKIQAASLLVAESHIEIADAMP